MPEFSPHWSHGHLNQYRCKRQRHVICGLSFKKHQCDLNANKKCALFSVLILQINTTYWFYVIIQYFLLDVQILCTVSQWRVHLSSPQVINQRVYLQPGAEGSKARKPCPLTRCSECIRSNDTSLGIARHDCSVTYRCYSAHTKQAFGLTRL